MNIIIKGCDVIHNTYKLQWGTKVVTPIAFYYRSPLRYRSSPINHHTGPRITASGSHLSFLSICFSRACAWNRIYLFSNYPKIFICKFKYQKLVSVRPDKQAINLEWPQCPNLYWRPLPNIVPSILIEAHHHMYWEKDMKRVGEWYHWRDWARVWAKRTNNII